MRLVSFCAVLIFMNFWNAIVTYAAPVNYTSNTTVSLTSPAINVTIISGSTADSVTVNGTNITVTMSSSTGGNFTLDSSVRDLSVTADSAGGTISNICNAGTAEISISQTSGSSNYTITPLSNPCTGATLGGNGGGGGGYSPVTYPSVTSSTTAQNIASLQAQLESLKSTLRTLVAQARKAGIPISSEIQSYIGAVKTFLKSLTLGSKGDDVVALQSFLIAQNKGPAAKSLSSVGATGLFGSLTKKAVKEYQGLVGLPATGYFGPLTRAYINSLNQQ